MCNINPNIFTHNIFLSPNAKPIKQKICTMNHSISLLVKAEIEKPLNVNFIQFIDYCPLIPNILVVFKGENKIWMYFYFHDLNKSSLEDDLSLVINIILLSLHPRGPFVG